MGRKIRSTIVFIIIAAMSAGLCACGKSGDDKGGG